MLRYAYVQSIPAHDLDWLDSFDINNIHAGLVSKTFHKPGLQSTLYGLPGFHLIRNNKSKKGGGSCYLPL